MRILLLATGYLPYTFSENLCNGKLVYAMQKEGWHVDVISRVDEGPAYFTEWTEPWLTLKPYSKTLSYTVGGKITRAFDTLYSALQLGMWPDRGIRWAARAYKEACRMCETNHYDAVFTRSPGDIPHIIGLRLKQKFGIRWIANWNDPAAPIWPEPYTYKFSSREQARKMAFTAKCLRGADVNAFPSEWLQKHFESYFPFLKMQKTAVIPHICLHETIVPKAALPQRLGRFRMCHSGNLSAERNPEKTFTAMRELIDEGMVDIEFNIMGHVNDYTRDMIASLQLEDNVKCIGGFPYMEALKKMQEYDCLVLLEAVLEKGVFFASKFTDYAQLERPILAISPKVGFAESMISRYGGGVFTNNEDSESIKSGIRKLYDSWKKGTLQTDYETAHLYKQFSADQVIGLYKDLLK